MDLLILFEAIGGLLGLVLLYCMWFARETTTHLNERKAMEAPEPPGAWPIIGHLLQLATPQPLYRTLAAMADKKGPIFTVRFGVHRTLVISSGELAKECFTINDIALAGRTRSAASDHMTYDYAIMAFTSYGPYWREVRKWMILELLSKGRLESLRHIQYAEINYWIENLYGLWISNNRNQIKIEMNRLFHDLTMNMVLKTVVGKRYFSAVIADDNIEVKRIQSTFLEFLKLMGVSPASDLLPSFLSWMDWDGKQRAMKRVAKEMDVVAESWLQEHLQKRKSAENGDGSEQDFMDVMLSILEEGAQFHGHDRETVVKATALNLIIAATGTSTSSLSWAITLLLNNKQVLTKAQKELDFHVGMERKVEEKDIANLVYLQAIIKETLRLYPTGPLLIPHEAIEDCTISGFKCSKGTRVLVNAWKIHRSPQVWSNPSEFQPERFLTTHADIDVRGKNFELIPFGSGRRSCPGISYALQIMHMTLARFLHEFELKAPTNEPLDMTEGTGLTMPRETPLEILLSPRLPSHVYG